MNITLIIGLIIGWYLIGFISLVLGTKIIHKQVTVNDLLDAFHAALFGPFLSLLLIYSLIANFWDGIETKCKKYKDKVIW